MPQASIARLSSPTRVKLRSTQILTSIPQIVSELLQNSLDSGASHIDIGVDCAEWTCWVRDDGHGISKEGISLLGHGAEEGRYMTSKTYTSNCADSQVTFGFRGEALASAAEISCLEISSRTLNSRNTWSVILKGGKKLYEGPAVRWRREFPGSAVCVRDVFYNLPVRRLSHPSTTRTMELVRQELESYALMFPTVAFSLENISSAREANSSYSPMRIPKMSSSLASFRHLYGRALAEHVDELHLSSGAMKLEGFISLSGAHSKAYQFLYVNRHPLASCDLHRIIDSRFGSSSFCKNALDEAGETGLPRSTVRRSPRKAQMKPVYVLNLIIPSQYVDNFLEPTKTAMHFEDRNAVISFLSSSIQSFLDRHGFSTGATTDTHKSSRDHSASPRKRRKIYVEEDSGYAEAIECTDPSALTPLDLTRHHPTPLDTSHNLDATHDDKIAWTDFNTGESFIVDVRTGNSVPSTKTVDQKDDLPPYFQARRTLFRGKSNNDRSAPKPPIPEWIRAALKENQSYAMTERHIALVTPTSTFAPNNQTSIPLHGCHGSVSLCRQTQGFGLDMHGVTHRFKKEDLGRIQIINQVDRKFIACLIPGVSKDEGPSTPSDRAQSDNGLTLVLIDQHAADERVRVERFLKELCLGFLHSRDKGEDPTNNVQVRELDPPLPLLLTRHETLRLEGSHEIQEAFGHWGIRFAELSKARSCNSDDSSDFGNQNGYMQVRVQSIPDVVSDKLLSGDELRDLTKGYLGQLETDMPVASQQSVAAADVCDEFFWLKALRWCPRGLLDLVNSKACRGAIMFNDPLSVKQCERLVHQLSQTAFPFQCAHGRPSLVPLVDVGAPTDNLGRRIESQVQWSRLETMRESG